MNYNRFDFYKCKKISEKDFETLLNSGCSPQKGDILISKDGANCLDIIFVYNQEKKIVLLSSIAIVRLKNGYSSTYYRYYLLSPITQKLMKDGFISGSAIPRVILKNFKKVPLSVPPLSEQKSIAKILSDLDSKIELLQQQNKTLEEIGKTLFKHWFVDFEFPNEEGKPYKSSGCEMVESELGEIPKGWGVDKLGNYVESISGCSYTSKGLEVSDEALVTLKSIGVNGFKQEGFKEYTGEYKEKHVVKDGDIVVAHTDLTQNRIILGKPAIVRDLGKYRRMIASMDLSIVNPIKLLNKSFLFYLLNTNQFHAHAQAYANGTTVIHLSRKAIPEFIFIVPNNQLLVKFQVMMDDIFDKFRLNKLNIVSLSKTRDLLLPELMSGKIRVPITVKS